MRGLLLFQGVSEIEKKMEEAPDSSYEIGVVIGTYLPLSYWPSGLRLLLFLQKTPSRLRKGDRFALFYRGGRFG